MLTDKQKRFCEEYSIDYNASRAAVAAGYSKKTARVTGPENLTKPAVAAYVEQLMHEKRIRCRITEDTILEELQAMGLYSIKTFLEAGNSVKDLTTLSHEQLRPVTGIKVKEIFTPEGREVTTELKFADKRASLVDLGRYLGMFEKDNKQKLPPAAQMSDDQFEQTLKAIRETQTNSGK